jgi:beta-1,4-mannosyltransferase
MIDGVCMNRWERQDIQPVRIVTIPGPRHVQNSYFRHLWRALKASGAEMISARSTAAMLLRYDVFHIHLPDVLVEKPIHVAAIVGPFFVLYFVVSKIAGKKLVWTIHEVTASRPHLLTRPFLWCMRRLSSALIFMNKTSEDEYLKRYPGQRHKLIARVPHSFYPTIKISSARRCEIRASLTNGADCLAVGYLGEIKPYKNAGTLQYLPTVDNRQRPLRIVVAGTLHESCDVPLTEATFRTIPQLIRIKDRLSDERLAELVQSIDLIFLPYLRGWNSGFAMFALGCRARLLCSRLPMFREIAEVLGRPWVYIFDHNAADLRHELATAMAEISQEAPNASDQARLDRFLAARSFDQAALQHLTLYRKLALGRTD